MQETNDGLPFGLRFNHDSWLRDVLGQLILTQQKPASIFHKVMQVAVGPVQSPKSAPETFWR